MKTTTRVKKINGHEYIYEISYYYDKETRRTKQKSRYLGKNVEGKPIRVREKAKTPEYVYSYGEFIPYVNAVKQLNLQELLSAHLSDHEIKLLLSLVFAGIISPYALQSPPTWFEATVLPRIFSGLKITGKNVTKLLKKLGEGSLQLNICRSLSSLSVNGDMRVFCIEVPMSQASSCSIGKTHPNNEPIIIFYDNTNNIPISYLSSAHYLISSELSKGVTAGLHLFSGKKAVLIPGKTYQSSLNFYGAVYSEIPSIITIDPDHDLIKEEIQQIRTELMHPKNLKIFRGETLFVVPVNISLEQLPVKGYIIYSPRREEEIRERYAEDISVIVENLNNKPVYRWINPAEAILDVAGEYEPFIQWQVNNNRLIVDIKRKTLGKHLKNCGISVIITSESDYQWDTCLEWVEERRETEEFLVRFFKNFQTFPFSVDRDILQTGAFFVSFMALLLNRWVYQQYSHSGLLSIYTPERILLELMKIRLIGLGNEKAIYTGVQLHQKEILEMLKWNIELSL